MPYGFRGNAAEHYLQAVEIALSDAMGVHSQNPFVTTPSAFVPLPELGTRENATIPHPSNTAHSGESSSGTGSSSNIVVDDNEYCTFLEKISQADYNIGATIYRVTNEIDTLCETSFDVPLTTQEVIILALGTRNSMAEFAELIHEIDTEMRNFVSNILEIS
ncbi:MAG: hypothetical protein FWD05_04425 [Oscillospiraceae bacterium]|nr:hypothetical protein [Oscillospiraceae bacterium]